MNLENICRFPNQTVHNLDKLLPYKEKARESVPVTRPTHQGLRTARSSKTSNAEAHADMYNN